MRSTHSKLALSSALSPSWGAQAHHPRGLLAPLALGLALSSALSLVSARVYAEDESSTGESSTGERSTGERSEDSLWVTPPSETGAEEVNFDERGIETPPRFDWDRFERESSSDHVFVEHHGYLRFRADMHYNLDLNTYSSSERRGTSQYLPPLTSRVAGVRQESESLASANMRFRYEPTIHLGEQLRVHTTLDLPDNLVLGSTPDGGTMSATASGSPRPDVPFEGLNDSQAPLKDALSLRYLWGVWDTELARVEFGRMRHHWGLGLLANGGACLDCNFGDAIDRVQVTTQLFEIYVSASWDLPGEGPTGFGLTPQTQGQAWDWDQRDDVSQYSVALRQQALSPQELSKKRAALDAGQLVFEWGAYGLMRHQKNAAAYLDLGSATGAPTSPEPDDEQWTLYPAQLELFIPDLFLSWTYQPSPSSRFSLKAEGVGLFGSVDQVPLGSFAVLDRVACATPSLSAQECSTAEQYQPRERSISSWGYAVELDAKVKSVLFGVHHGGASGDNNSGYFGDGPLSDPSQRDSALNGFRFDRDYIVDLILFREVLGGVYNALYFKPYLGVELERKTDLFWGLKASAMYAMAMDPAFTPGGESGLGLEFDVEAYLYEVNRFRASLAYGALFPMGGLNLLNEQRDTILKQASTAQTLQLNLGLMF